MAGTIGSASPPRPAPGRFTGARNAESDLAAYALVDRAIERLAVILDQETLALRSRARLDLNDFNNKKTQGLLDLSRAMRQLDVAGNEERLRERLDHLRGKLDANRAVLKVHLEAVSEIATAMSEAIRDTESDGTYTPSIRVRDYEA
jgi:hypothetical protein